MMINKKHLTLFLALTVLSSTALVYGQDMKWIETYGWDYHEYFEGARVTSDGGFIITGNTLSNPTEDAFLIKTDSSGATEWINTYGDYDTIDYFYDVEEAHDGGFITTGLSNSYSKPGQSGANMWLYKTDADGDFEWWNTFGALKWELGNSISKTSDGGYILLGATYSWGVGKSDFYLVKTYADGTLDWQDTYGGTGSDMGLDVEQTSDDGFILVGRSLSYNTGFYGDDLYMVKTDSSGVLEWQKNYGNADVNDAGIEVKQTPDGGYIVAGFTVSLGSGNDGYLVKTDENGDLEWSKTYGGLDGDMFLSVDLTSDGGYILTGDSSDGENNVVWIVKTDANGNMEWEEHYLEEASSRGNWVKEMAPGEYAVAGEFHIDPTPFDIFLMNVGPSTLTPTIEQAIEDIENKVDHHGIRNSLIKKLENALKALEKGNTNAYENILQAFINQVTAQSGKKIPAEYADQLIEWAEAWIEDPNLAI